MLRAHSPRPPPALPRLFPVPGNGAAYVTGWTAGAGLGPPPSPTAGQPLRARSPCGDVGEGTSHTRGNHHAQPGACQHLLPPVLAQKMAQPPSPRIWRPPVASPSPTQSRTASVSLAPLTLRGRGTVFAARHSGRSLGLLCCPFLRFHRVVKQRSKTPTPMAAVGRLGNC